VRASLENMYDDLVKKMNSDEDYEPWDIDSTP